MLIILSHLRALSKLGEEQLERITSVFEPEEAEEGGIDESNDEDQTVNLYSLTCRRYEWCDKD